MDENKNMTENEKEEVLTDITKHICGKRLCKCGKDDCEFAADFFDENGKPAARLGTDDDLLENDNLEAAEDFSDYARRCGMLGAYDYDGVCENGEAIYHNTAQYRMIDPSGESVDAGKS